MTHLHQITTHVSGTLGTPKGRFRLPIEANLFSETIGLAGEQQLWDTRYSRSSIHHVSSGTSAESIAVSETFPLVALYRNIEPTICTGNVCVTYESVETTPIERRQPQVFSTVAQRLQQRKKNERAIMLLKAWMTEEVDITAEAASLKMAIADLNEARSHSRKLYP